VACALICTACGASATESYLTALDDAGLADQFAADRAAIAAAERTCDQLDLGGPAQGTEVELIAVEWFCADYAEAFKVLEVIEVRGSFTLTDDESLFLPLCSGDGGYSDINSSTAVILRDRDGNELARSELGFGEPDTFSCIFTFSLQDVSEGAPGDVYVLEVGDRGEIAYSFAELRVPGAIQLAIGS